MNSRSPQSIHPSVAGSLAALNDHCNLLLMKEGLPADVVACLEYMETETRRLSALLDHRSRGELVGVGADSGDVELS